MDTCWHTRNKMVPRKATLKTVVTPNHREQEDLKRYKWENLRETNKIDGVIHRMVSWEIPNFMCSPFLFVVKIKFVVLLMFCGLFCCCHFFFILIIEFLCLIFVKCIILKWPLHVFICSFKEWLAQGQSSSEHIIPRPGVTLCFLTNILCWTRYVIPCIHLGALL